ncbi:hypothetical protein ElyMa_002826800 [Elysia marginata]|uniref:Uncharacterized protein n=1 Tax=Elysia marginata TaxID=1093978 RepID=A0AAV4HRY7_9GAST|nr:hypothetical protein ElyMa_002826800 [Elysia marginata]
MLGLTTGGDVDGGGAGGGDRDGGRSSPVRRCPSQLSSPFHLGHYQRLRSCPSCSISSLVILHSQRMQKNSPGSALHQLYNPSMFSLSSFSASYKRTGFAPNKPTCSALEFVEDDTAVRLTCTSDRVYPTALCIVAVTVSQKPFNTVALVALPVQKAAAEFQEKYRLSVTDTVVNSTRYPGDRELTCMFRMHLTHIQEGRFTFAVNFRAPVRDYKPTIKHADSIPALDLNKPTQPICEELVFADGGSTAVVTCTADRVVPPSTCEFRLTANSPALEKTYRQHKEADQDSVIYPGYSRAQCTLRMPLTGNRAGDYQFQVEFTSRDSLKSEPTLTSKISLSE